MYALEVKTLTVTGRALLVCSFFTGTMWTWRAERGVQTRVAGWVWDAGLVLNPEL
jgi:hypothetical protein